MYLRLKTKIELDNRIENQIILQEIRSVLEDCRFDNIETINDSVLFRNNFWEFGSSASYKAHISKGFLQIITEDYKTKILYKSFIPLWGYLAVIGFIIIVGFRINDFFIIGFLVLFFGVFMSYLTVKNGNLALMNKLKDKMKHNK
ncbi:MAG: hypothetical protein JXJ22_04285 [Bacteroidales bacterium]|nr:hypothetical protein [Bacteroidales bacterium]